MSDLAEFLLARIAEDEATARAAGGEFWFASQMPPHPSEDDPLRWILDSPARLVSYEMTTEQYARHAVAWSPERILAECEAKRRIVERVTDGCPHPPRVGGWCIDHCDAILSDLALPYADHPDCRDEWKP